MDASKLVTLPFYQLIAQQRTPLQQARALPWLERFRDSFDPKEDLREIVDVYVTGSAHLVRHSLTDTQMAETHGRELLQLLDGYVLKTSHGQDTEEDAALRWSASVVALERLLPEAAKAHRRTLMTLYRGNSDVRNPQQGIRDKLVTQIQGIQKEGIIHRRIAYFDTLLY